MLKDIKSLFKNSVIYGLANLSNKVAGIILTPILTSRLSTFEYGAYALLLLTSYLLISIFGLGLYQGLFRWYWEKDLQSRQKSLFYTILITTIGVVLAMYLLVFPFSGQISKLIMNSAQYSNLVILILISAGLEIIIQMPNTLIRLQEKSGLYLTASLVKLSVSLSLSIYFLVYAGKKLDGIFEATIIAQLVYLIMISRYTWKNIEFKFESSILKDLFQFSLPLGISSVAAMALSSTDRYALKFLSSVDDVAFYNIGFLISNVVFLLIMSVNTALWPMIYKKMNDKNNKRFYSKIMTYYAFSIMFVILGVAFFSQEGIKILTPKAVYWDAYKFIPLLNIGVFFIMLKEISSIGINLAKKTKIIATIVFSVTLLDIGFDFLLIPKLTYYGAAIAYMLTQIIYFALVYYFSQKYYPIPFEIVKTIKILLLGFVLFLIVYQFRNYNIYIRLSIKTILLLAYPFLLYLMNFFEEIEIQSIKNGWNKWRNPKNWNFK